MKALGKCSIIAYQGIKSLESENQYYLSIIADDNGNLWMLTYENGAMEEGWKRPGPLPG